MLFFSDVLTLLFDMLSTGEIDVNLMDQYRGMHGVFVTAVQLLRTLARQNSLVQRRLFDRFEALLHTNGIEKEVALLLRDVSLSINLTASNHFHKARLVLKLLL